MFLDLLGTIVPPLSGIILSDYFFVHKGKYLSLEKAKFAAFNPVPWITWAVSLVIIYLVPAGLPSLNGIICGGVLYPIFMKISKTKVISEEV